MYLHWAAPFILPEVHLMHSPTSLNGYALVQYVSPPQPVTAPSEYPTRVTIGKLSDEVLLNIFRYYLDASPRFWPRLVHICRKWRHIVFASQRVLHLRLFCTHGTPILKTLGFWPALPIVVEYGGSLELDPPAPEDEVNIMAALKQSDSVVSISLTITSSLLERLFAIEKPFSELENLVLLSQNNEQLILPDAFQWGPRLRRLHSTRIAFPSLLQLLYSSRNLVDLQLHDVLNPLDFFPKVLTNALSGMAQLRSLSLHFLPTAYYHAPPLPPGERVVLPDLIRLNFRGIANYLEGLVARIDVPRLMDIEFTVFDGPIFDLSKLIEPTDSPVFDLPTLSGFTGEPFFDLPTLSDFTFFDLSSSRLSEFTGEPIFSVPNLSNLTGAGERIFNPPRPSEFNGEPIFGPPKLSGVTDEPIFDLPKVSEFIDRIEMPKSHRRAHILSSESVISISLTWPGVPTHLELHLLCEPLRVQLSSMAHICTQSSALLSNVEDLCISAMRPSSWEDTGGAHNIVLSLNLSRKRRETLLPSLYKLYLPPPGSRHAPLSEALVSFAASRQLSGHPIGVEYGQPCHISELRGTGTTTFFSASDD
ncbi:hypothetical protein EDB92DRAFT_1535458 [Lactarius akahatsu]|uniref:F-box domain-containing protein n=1 Tax=Lactarius akahatsu TaxID=416441 RepID=A0AAD4QG91_9AGAM|nr:hypothetical protein EDB92DRAFT_1535458 [Lactarius akahatsu]